MVVGHEVDLVRLELYVELTCFALSHGHTFVNKELHEDELRQIRLCYYKVMVITLTQTVHHVFALFHGIQLGADLVEELTLEVAPSLLEQGPAVLHLRLRQQRGLVFLNDKDEVLFYLEYSGAQVCLQYKLNSLQLHAKQVLVEAFIRRRGTCLLVGSFGYLAILLID